MIPSRTARLQTALSELERWQRSGTPARQRRFTRFPARGDARVHGGAARPLAADIRDVSRGGIGLLVPSPIEPGTPLRLDLAAGGLAISTLPGCCRFARPIVDGAYLVGVEFGVEASLLMALGVAADDVAAGDLPESGPPMPGTFLAPDRVLDDDAA